MKTPADVAGVASSLASVGIFRDRDPAILHRLGAELEWLTLDAGEALIRQGTVGDALYVLMSGRLGLFLEGSSGGEEPVGDVGKGETVGELALIAGQPHAATVLAFRPSVLARLTRASVERVQREYPALTSHMMRMLAERLHAMPQPDRAAARGSTIALVGASDDPAVRAFAARFVASLGRFGTTCHLTRERVNEAFASPIRSDAIDAH